MSKVSVEQWIELFHGVGLKEADMKKWHHLFESKNPEGHQDFLEWLGLDEKKIKDIRNM